MPQSLHLGISTVEGLILFNPSEYVLISFDRKSTFFQEHN